MICCNRQSSRIWVDWTAKPGHPCSAAQFFSAAGRPVLPLSPENSGAFLILASGNPLWQHRDMIEFCTVSDRHPDPGESLLAL